MSFGTFYNQQLCSLYYCQLYHYWTFREGAISYPPRYKVASWLFDPGASRSCFDISYEKMMTQKDFIRVI